MAQDTNIGERRRDVLATIIGRRMSFADQFFGVGERPYDMKQISDADLAEFQAWKAAKDAAKMINGQG